MTGAAVMTAERWVSTREAAQVLTGRLGKPVSHTTVFRRAQKGLIPARVVGGKVEAVELSGTLSSWNACAVDPDAALGHLVRDGVAALPTLALVAPAGAAPAPAPLPTPPPANNDQAAFLRARREGAEIRTLNERLDLEERQKSLAPVEPLRAAFTRRLVALVQQVETALPDAARLLADDLGCDQHAAATVLRRWYRTLRADLAKTARIQGEALPELAPADAAPTGETA